MEPIDAEFHRILMAHLIMMHQIGRVQDTKVRVQLVKQFNKSILDDKLQPIIREWFATMPKGQMPIDHLKNKFTNTAIGHRLHQLTVVVFREREVTPTFWKEAALELHDIIVRERRQHHY